MLTDGRDRGTRRGKVGDSVCTVLSIVAWAIAACGEGQEQAITLEVSPTKQSFAAGEAVALRMSVRNVSSRTLTLLLDYPHRLARLPSLMPGLAFACPDRRGAPSLLLIPEMDRGQIPFDELAPGAQRDMVFALNRYLNFAEPGRYAVEYTGLFQEATRSGPDEHVVFRYHCLPGSFSIRIRQDRVTPDTVRQLARGLTRGSPFAPEESVDLLCWTDHPSVIDALLSAAETVPAEGVDIVVALRRFQNTEEGRRGIVRMTRSSWGPAARAARELCALLDIRPPGLAPLEPTQIPLQLPVGGLDVQEARLRFLLRSGASEHLGFVRALKANGPPRITALAAEVESQIGGRDGVALPCSGPRPMTMPLVAATAAALLGLAAYAVWRRNRSAHRSPPPAPPPR